MIRTPISTLLQSDSPFRLGRISDADAEKHGIAEHTRHGAIGIFDCLRGRLVGFIDEDEIYDPSGNRFELDE
jgi:hypothetical protein